MFFVLKILLSVANGVIYLVGLSFFTLILWRVLDVGLSNFFTGMNLVIESARIFFPKSEKKDFEDTERSYNNFIPANEVTQDEPPRPCNNEDMYNNEDIESEQRFAMHFKEQDGITYSRWASNVSDKAKSWLDERRRKGDNAPVVAVLGIVNAGKSTLMQHLFNIPTKTGVVHTKSVVMEVVSVNDKKLILVDLPGIGAENDSGWEHFQTLLDASERVLFAIHWRDMETQSIIRLSNEIRKAMATKRLMSEDSKSSFPHLKVVITCMDDVDGSLDDNDPKKREGIQEVVANGNEKYPSLDCYFTGIHGGRVKHFPELEIPKTQSFDSLKKDVFVDVSVRQREDDTLNKILDQMAYFSSKTIINTFGILAGVGGFTIIPGDSQLAILTGCMVLIRKHLHIYEWNFLRKFAPSLTRGAVCQFLFSCSVYFASGMIGMGLIAANMLKSGNASAIAFQTLTKVNNVLKNSPPGEIMQERGEIMQAIEAILRSNGWLL